eukprot:79266-Chlamydomonas_euryale.AAC.1
MDPRVLAVAAALLAMFLLTSVGKGAEPNEHSSLMPSLLSKLELSSSTWLPKLALSCEAVLLLRKRFTVGEHVYMPTCLPSHLHRWALQKAQASLATPYRRAQGTRRNILRVCRPLGAVYAVFESRLKIHTVMFPHPEN